MKKLYFKTMTYLHLKFLHILLVVSSYSLFFIRGVWSLNSSAIMQKQWIRVVPHIVDTMLLIIALTLAFTIRQFPFVEAWLTAKVFGLFLYIGLGFIALSKAISKPIRLFAWLAAQTTFAYIALVAITHNPIPQL
jgi:uncharacterized membrane protein SirB2